jgi:hypothetical protein
MSGGHAWRGNWKVRLFERVRELGDESLTAFANARPAVPLVALADELGEDDIDDTNRFKVAMALGSWAAFTPGTHEERVRQAREALRATPPPPGWRPLGPDDEWPRTLLPDEESLLQMSLG